MYGRIVFNKGICIVEYCGERLYLPLHLSRGFQIGDTIQFDEIIDTQQNLRQINQVLSKPTLQNYELKPLHPKDLTHLNTFSVDPKGSLDLDDAITITQENIYIHIPYFKLNAEDHAKAYQQQYSIYFDQLETYHLLPLHLSTKKYSLLENKLRLTWTLQFNSEMQFEQIYKAYIVNKHQLSYNQTHECIDQALQIYKKYAQPTEDIPTFEYIIQDHKLVEIVPKIRSETHKMVEYFMIQSNIAVAEYINAQNKVFPRRVHDSCKETQINTAFPQEIAQYFKIIKSPAAYYTIQNKSHAHLNVNSYTHFTSPIRRYIDQVVARILDGENFTEVELNEICTQANIQERKIEALHDEYLKTHIEEYIKTHPIQKGVITHVSEWGIHVLLMHLRTTAQLHVSKLAQNKERLIYQNGVLQGTYTFKLGDKIEIVADQLEWTFTA